MNEMRKTKLHTLRLNLEIVKELTPAEAMKVTGGGTCPPPSTCGECSPFVSTRTHVDTHTRPTGVEDDAEMQMDDFGW